MVAVLLDGQAFSVQKRGGISKVFANIVSEYLKEPVAMRRVKLRLGVFISNYVDIRDITPYPVWQLKTRRNYVKFSLVVNWVCLWILPYQILHSTHYFGHYLKRRPGTKHVVTLHDMIPEDFPEFFEGRYPHFQKGKFLEDADVIICVSEYTKSRLAHHYPHLLGNAKVIYNGVNLPVYTPKPSQRKSQFLYVGDRGSYKDFPIAASAFSMILEKYPQTNLLCIGGKPFSHEELALLLNLGINENTSQISVSEQELQQKYTESIATVISSRVEGFGLPVIEAMANNCLVIASDIPVFKEIAADAYLKFQSGNVESLFGRMLEVIEGLEDFQAMRISGFENAKRYSWDRMYQEMEKIYLELA